MAAYGRSIFGKHNRNTNGARNRKTSLSLMMAGINTIYTSLFASMITSGRVNGQVLGHFFYLCMALVEVLCCYIAKKRWGVLVYSMLPPDSSLFRPCVHGAGNNSQMCGLLSSFVIFERVVGWTRSAFISLGNQWVAWARGSSPHLYLSFLRQWRPTNCKRQCRPHLYIVAAVPPERL